MKTIVSALILLVIVLNVQGQRKELPMGDFDKIVISSRAVVHLTYGKNNRVEIDEGNEKKLLVITYGKTLQIQEIKKNRDLDDKSPIPVYVITDGLTNITVSGQGSIISKNTLETDDLNIILGGKGSVDLVVNSSNNIKLTMSGKGKSKVQGSSDRAILSVSGSGTLDASELETNFCKATVGGSGECSAYAKISLDVIISGSGIVRYKGNPDKINQRVAGQGKLEKM